jgi:hypothetical protein
VVPEITVHIDVVAVKFTIGTCHQIRMVTHNFSFRCLSLGGLLGSGRDATLFVVGLFCFYLQLGLGCYASLIVE